MHSGRYDCVDVLLPAVGSADSASQTKFGWFDRMGFRRSLRFCARESNFRMVRDVVARGPLLPVML